MFGKYDCMSVIISCEIHLQCSISVIFLSVMRWAIQLFYQSFKFIHAFTKIQLPVKVCTKQVYSTAVHSCTVFEYLSWADSENSSKCLFFQLSVTGRSLRGLEPSLRSFRWMQSLGKFPVNNSQVSNEEHYQTCKCCKSSPQNIKYKIHFAKTTKTKIPQIRINPAARVKVGVTALMAGLVLARPQLYPLLRGYQLLGPPGLVRAECAVNPMI